MGVMRVSIVVWAAMMTSDGRAQPSSGNGRADVVQRPDLSTQSEQATSAGFEADAELAGEMSRIALDRANQRLKQGRYHGAIAMAWAGMRSVQKLAPSSDVASLTEPLLQVIVNARIAQRDGRETENQNAARPCAKIVPDDGTMESNATASTTTANASEPRPTARNQVRRREDSAHKSEADLYRADRSPGPDLIARQGIDPRIPQKVVVYPHDWVTQSRRRKQRFDGILHQSEAVRGDDGKVRQMMIYDVRSLTFPSLRFQRIPWSDLNTVTRNEADREALRRGSEIFNGYPRDLAAGIPLLDHFGGTGDWPADIGDGQEELAELMRLINAVIAEP